MRSNSWIVTSKATGEAVLETFSAKVAAAINLERYTVEPSHEYLARFNRSVRAA